MTVAEHEPGGPAFDEVVSCIVWRRATVRFRLRAWPAERVAVATELADNPGPSVTNAAEDVWPFAVETLRLAGHVADGWRQVEHYDDRISYGAATVREEPRLAAVTIVDGAAKWAPLPADLAWLPGALA